MSEEKTKLSLRKTDWRNFGIISLFLLLILLWVSPYSPLYRYIFHTDLVCYKVMAKGLLQGKIPYRDLFDHKGPVTYFIYAIGFLLPGNLNIGAFVLCWIINCVAFIYAYKCNRLFFGSEVSLLATMLILLVNALTIFNIFLTGSMPDNFTVAPLMISTYLFLKETMALRPDPEDPNGKKTEKSAQPFRAIRNRSILIIGLMCGLVFMTKLNICLFYFVFIGAYLLWLLVKKKVVVFLQNTGCFLLGIALVFLPCVLFLASHHAISDFIDVYIRFNLGYSKGGLSLLFWTSTSIPVPAKISMTILLLLSVLVTVLKWKGMDRQKRILTVLSYLSFIVLSLPDNIVYFYIVFVPLYVMVFGVLSEFLLALTDGKTNAVQLSVILIAVIAVTLGMQFYICGYIKPDTSQKEQTLLTFRKAHPDATCMSFFSTTVIGYYEYCNGIPDFRVFYQPPIATDELVEEQISEVVERLPDTIVYIGVGDDAYDSAMQAFIEKNGYVLYCASSEDYDAEYFYVRKEFTV